MKQHLSLSPLPLLPQAQRWQTPDTSEHTMLSPKRRCPPSPHTTWGGGVAWAGAWPPRLAPPSRAGAAGRKWRRAEGGGDGGEVRLPGGAPGEVRGEHPAARHHRQRLPAQQPDGAQSEIVRGRCRGWAGLCCGAFFPSRPRVVSQGSLSISGCLWPRTHRQGQRSDPEIG